MPVCAPHFDEKIVDSIAAVSDAAVIGIPSERWGETPLGLIVLTVGANENGETILQWAHGQLGKARRLAAVECRDYLPRSTIDKVLKRELREPYWKA